MAITFPTQPPYKVDFQAYKDLQPVTPLSLLTNIGSICKVSLTFFYVVGRVFCQATWETIQNSPKSFKYIVLGYKDFNLARGIFRIAYWVIGLGLHWMSAFFNGLALEYQLSQSRQLEGLVDPGINLNHITSGETALDASSVSKEIQVRTLLEAFDQINFTDPSRSAFFPESARKIDDRVYSVKELRKNLNTFINNVENRKAIRGTPPAYDTKKLFTYYQYIEDATRLTLEKVLNGISQFEKNHSAVVCRFKREAILPSDQDYPLAQQYQNLIENRSRLALDFAFTGDYCGARYTGDAASAYNFYYKQKGITDLSLRDQLHSLLAHKRREIADSQIASLSAKTHTYSEYMHKLGRVLGLPGTAHIVEHLSTSAIDRNAALNSFFKEYTEDYIIAAVQKEFCKSQSFRETVYEWLKSNVGEWKKDEKAQKIATIIRSIESIKDKDENGFNADDITAIEHLNIILESLQNQNVKIPVEIPCGSTFIEEMFALDEVKKRVKDRFENANPTESNSVIKKMEFQKNLKEKMQTFACDAHDWTPIDIKAIKRDLTLNAKIQEVKTHIQFEEDADGIIGRMIGGESDISQVVKEHSKKCCEAEFFAAIMEVNTSSHENELNVGIKAIVERDNKAYDVKKELGSLKIMNQLVGSLGGSRKQIPPTGLHGEALIQWLFEKENVKSCLKEVASERTNALVNSTKALLPTSGFKDEYLCLLTIVSLYLADYSSLVLIIQNFEISSPKDRDLLNIWVRFLTKCTDEDIKLVDDNFFWETQDNPDSLKSEFVLDAISKSDDFKDFMSKYYINEIKEELALAFPDFNEIKRVDSAVFLKQLVRNKKIQQISGLFHVNNQDAQLLLDNSHTIPDTVNKERSRFISTHGLTKEVMEWLLVDQGIFKPQIPVSKDVEHRALTAEEDSFKNAILAQSDNQQKSKRYVEESCPIRLQRVFNKAFEKNPEKIIHAAELTPGAYPLWKRAILIEMPHSASKICNSMKLRFILSFGGGIVFYISSRKVIQILSEAVASRGYPVLVKHTPEICRRAIKPMLSFYNWGQAHPFKYTGCVLIAYAVLKTINYQPAINLVHRAKHLLIAIPLNLTFLFIIKQTYETSRALNYSALAAGRFFNDMSELGLRDRKNHIRAYFVNITRVLDQPHAL